MTTTLPAIILTILAFLLPVLTLAFGLVTGIGAAPAVVSACTTVVFYLLAFALNAAYPPTTLPTWLAWLWTGVLVILLASWTYCLLWAAGVAL